MSPDLTIVHIDDNPLENTALLRACARDLQIPEGDVLWRISVQGGLDLFQELAKQQQKVAAVVCNGEIFWDENGKESKDLAKHGGLVTFARYQDLALDGRKVRETIGTPPWVHHTSNFPMSPILENWNRQSPAGDAMGGVSKLLDNDRALSAALAIVMHVRGVLTPEDPRVEQAIEDIQEDFRRGANDMKLQIGFSPSVHDYMKGQIDEAWPYRPEHRL